MLTCRNWRRSAEDREALRRRPRPQLGFRAIEGEEGGGGGGSAEVVCETA